MNDNEKQKLLGTIVSNLANLRHQMLNNTAKRLEEKKQGQKLLNRSQASAGEAQSRVGSGGTVFHRPGVAFALARNFRNSG